ncbi:hypothetical protein [Pseudomonas frederiksbergensis]|uniref:hypothetical protein n=1 Tax=Pseudomonas frederiksbergensis TaxID=104087 RepID=UPI00285E55F9|nr:hypothetical protein [Pseudomonas frederiksbergensis]MDR7109240.1 hypothetical protein [Pseudomonas frederiksbergensis]
MNGAAASSNDWSGFIAGVVATWNWFERLFVALWSGLGWPQAVLIMFCIAVVYFKAEIRNILPRIKSIGADGFELESPQPQIQPSVKQGELKAIPAGEFPHSFEIVSELVKKQIEEMSEKDALLFLLSDDVSWRVLWYFENIYSFIFGGQIKFLALLNQRGVAGVSLSEATREWEVHKENNKPQMDDWEMQPYLNFLVVKELIVIAGEEIKITITGKEFLMWMTKYGRSADRLW